MSFHKLCFVWSTQVFTTITSLIAFIPLDLPNNNYEFVEELTLTEASYGLSQA